MALQLMQWINKVTKLNKTTMETFQNNIKTAIDEQDLELTDINNRLETVENQAPAEREIVTCSLSTEQTLTNATNTLSLVNISTIVNITDASKFEIQGNGIKYKGEATKMLVSAMLSAKYDSPVGNLYLVIYKNGVEICRTTGSKPTANLVANSDLVNYLININKNDVIQLYTVGAQGMVLYSGRTYITLEAIN